MKKTIRRNLLLCLLPTALCLLPTAATAARIADVTTPSNERTNTVTGMGLVFGLKGTGDGGDFLPTIQMLAAAMSKFDNVPKVVDLKNVKNVAIVMLSTTIPATGARDGDLLDVTVTSIGAASSIKDGMLFSSTMVALGGPNPNIIVGEASGKVSIEGTTSPTNGVVHKGCRIEGAMPAGDIKGGVFSFYLDEPSATMTMACNIAKIINDSEDGQPWATAVIAKEIVVRIPPGEQQYPAGFISRLQQLPLPTVPAEARVVINERTGTIVVTGDVEISPVVISHKGLTITTVLPTPVPSARAPVIKTTDVVAMDTANTGGAKLQDLMSAMDQLKVPVQDRIDILKELKASGKMHAKLIPE